MKVQPPVKIGGINTNPPVDLVDDITNDAVRLGGFTSSAIVIMDRSLWFVDAGSPPDPTTIGAKDGDCYLNSDTGDTYRLVNMGWVHITNIKGPQGASGGDIFEHNQSSPLQDWTINHNLGRYPELTIIGADGNQIITDVEHVSINTAIVHFATPITGKAVCN